MNLNVIEYSSQTYYAFSKLAELFFEKGKLYNASLIVRLRALVTILEYDEKSKDNVAGCIFKLGVLLKKLKFFNTTHTDQQLLKEVQNAIRDRNARK